VTPQRNSSGQQAVQLKLDTIERLLQRTWSIVNSPCAPRARAMASR
jgi:hypothetical protein